MIANRVRAAFRVSFLLERAPLLQRLEELQEPELTTRELTESAPARSKL